MKKGMREMATMAIAIEHIIQASPKTPSKQEASKVLRSCGILNSKNEVKSAYKTIVIKSSSSKK